MAKKRRSEDFDLREAIRQPGFTPSVRDVEAIVALVAEGDEDDAKAGTRALMQVPDAALACTATRLEHALVSAREDEAMRLCRLLSRLPEAGALPPLVAALGGSSMRVRRAAAVALGKLGGEGVEEALLVALDSSDASARRAIVEALGKVGGDAAARALASIEAGDDAELARRLERAHLVLDREAARLLPVSLDRDARAPQPILVELRCRRGLEPVLLDELRAIRGVVDPRGVEHGRVRLRLDAAPSSLDAARTWYELRFPLPVARAPAPARDRGARGGRARSGGDARPTPEPEAMALTIVDALTSPDARRLLETFTRGTPRVRVDFEGAGKQRGLTFRVAALLAERGLVNDPREAPWEARVAQARNGAVEVCLVPRGFDDPRFAHRLADVPAASHPTIAAALAHLAGAHPDDVVWDPFVGSGSELIERGRLGPHRALLGTDTDPRALEAARANLDAAGLAAELVLTDATRFVPRVPPTLVISNPPMGRRVHRGDVAPLLARVAEAVVRVASPEARIVWLDPSPAAVGPVLTAGGFRLARAFSVDLGGFDARLELWQRG